MKTKGISTNIDNGMIYYSDHSDNITDIEWSKHPTFKGVYLKHMIQSENTHGFFSSHIVKIAPNCCLETHCHENQLELHEVVEGDGICQLIEKTFDYNLGKMSVIQRGESHMVKAGENGLTLLAKFFPALL